MRTRDARKVRPAPEGLEWRLAPSGFSPGGPPQEVRHDGGGGHDRDGKGDRDGGNNGAGRDNGSWEPKPVGHGSTRPQVPTGPVRW